MVSAGTEARGFYLRKMPPLNGAAFVRLQNQLFCGLLLSVFTLLICDAAAGLAGGLTGSLAFAAAALLCALAKIAGLDGLNMTHVRILLQPDVCGANPQREHAGSFPAYELIIIISQKNAEVKAEGCPEWTNREAVCRIWNIHRKK